MILLGFHPSSHSLQGSQPARFKRLARDGFERTHADVQLIEALLDALEGAAAQLSEKQREVVGKWRRDFGASFGGTAADESDSTAAAVAEGPDDERTG